MNLFFTWIIEFENNHSHIFHFGLQPAHQTPCSLLFQTTHVPCRKYLFEHVFCM
uniref:Uncharacterized protein n=1 Tax=Anguilla anguilla TaxID=7936 RepID=A0A0E9SEF7_ANGAN